MAGKDKRPYLRLDIDWFDDPKFIDFETKNGHKLTGDALKVFTVCRTLDREEMTGIVDMNNSADAALLARKCNLTDKALRKLLDAMAQCSLIDKCGYELGLVGSERTIFEAEESARRKAQSSEAIRKRWEAEKRRRSGE